MIRKRTVLICAGMFIIIHVLSNNSYSEGYYSDIYSRNSQSKRMGANDRISSKTFKIASSDEQNVSEHLSQESQKMGLPYINASLERPDEYAKSLAQIPEKFRMPSEVDPFHYLIWIESPTMKNVCKTKSALVIAVVISAADHFKRRNMIRNTYANITYWPQTKLVALFILGATIDDNIRKLNMKESEEYGDIIQMTYRDIEKNRIYKTMTALQWISETCKDIPWILKINDNVILNPFTLPRLLEKEFPKNSYPSTILGCVQDYSPAETHEEYLWETFPPYVLSSAYIIGRNAVESMIHFAKQTYPLSLENVFFTGFVATKAAIPLIHINDTTSSYKTFKDTSSTLGRPYTFNIMFEDSDVLWDKIWEKVYETRTL